MPPRIQLDRWKIIAGYVAFTAGVFVFFLFLTFPYGAVEKRISAEALGQGLYVKFGSMGPGVFGVSASNVQISKKIEGGDEVQPEAVILKSIALRPSLFPLGVAFRANVFGGTVTGAVGSVGDMILRLNIDDLNASDPNFKAISGLDMTGRFNGRLSLEIPKSPVPPSPVGGARPEDPDLSQAHGTLDLALKDLLVSGGTLKIPLYGEMTPVDLPKVALGNVEARVKFNKGLGTIEKFQGKGDDVDVTASGTLKLAKRLDYSEPNVDIRLKTEPDFTKRLGLLGSGLAMLPPDKDDPGFKLARMTGFLGRPTFNPGH